MPLSLTAQIDAGQRLGKSLIVDQAAAFYQVDKLIDRWLGHRTLTRKNGNFYPSL